MANTITSLSQNHKELITSNHYNSLNDDVGREAPFMVFYCFVIFWKIYEMAITFFGYIGKIQWVP